MQPSTERILTTHAGSLPRPDDLIELFRSQAPAEAVSARQHSAVADVVHRQAETGIDIIGDGEYGKATRGAVDYGPWQGYAYARLTGWEGADSATAGQGMFQRRDWRKFESFYREYLKTANFAAASMVNVFTGPITYTGQAAIRADVENLQAAIRDVQAADGFMTAVAPGSFARGRNRYYKTEEEFMFAIAEAMREEYQAIVEGGFILQIDDPGLPDTWDMIDPAPTVQEYQCYAAICVEALNHGLRGLPVERIRYHICWGSWHGPHTTDIPLRDVAGLMLSVNAGSFSVEAANVRHEHEWRVWQDVKLPDGKVLVPGVVSHATNVLEHPELVADRLINYANVVGRENVIAGTDCGLGGRIHPQLAWAKLRALRDGAVLATEQLWK